MDYLRRCSVQLMTLAGILLINTLFSCNEKKNPTNLINSLSDTHPEVSVRSWRVLGPFKDSINTGQLFYDKGTISSTLAISDTTADGVVHYKRLLDTIVNQQSGFFIDLKEMLSTTKPGFAYATCDIISEDDKEVVFLMGADDAIKVWINGELQFENDHLATYYEKNKIIEKVSLKKGLNQIILEIANIEEELWGFNLQVSTIKHVRENALFEDYYNPSRHFVIAIGDSLPLKVSNRDFIPIEKKTTIKIYNVAKELVMQQETNIKSAPKISLEGLNEGVYSFKLYTDMDTLDGMFAYGDIYRIYAANNLNEKTPFDKELYDTHSFVSKRAEYLLDYAKNRYLNWKLSKKIAFCLYRLAEIKHRYYSGQSIYGSGLQMRTFKSSIDNSDEYYQLYIPEKNTGKLPLVVMIPYVTTVRPFFWGAVVSNTERIEYIQKFADKFGFAVLWPSSKIYKRYNLTPIVSQTLNETLDDAAKHYPIDAKKLYLYGDCSGALQALLMATRHPDRFAAIGVEGTELGAVNFGNDGNDIPSSMISNSIFDLADNLRDIPVLVLHSKNDRKAPLKLVDKLIDSIRHYGGRVSYDDLGDGYKSASGKEVKMFSEQEIMLRIFKFFKNKKQTSPLEGFSYSTYGYYQNNVRGINVLNKFEQGEKATVRMQPLKENTLRFSTNNIKKMSIDLHQQKGINKDSIINVFFNGHLCFADKLANNRAPLKLTMIPLKDRKQTTESDAIAYLKPINKLFMKKFAVIIPKERDSSTDKTIQKLNIIWKWEYLTNIPVIDEASVPNAINQGMNLILIVNNLRNNNQYAALDFPNIEYNSSSISLNGKKTPGKQVSFAIISEHSKTGSHFLHIGSNYDGISENMLLEIIQQGWDNVEIWDPKQRIYQGNL